MICRGVLPDLYICTSIESRETTAVFNGQGLVGVSRHRERNASVSWQLVLRLRDFEIRDVVPWGSS